MLAKGPKQMSGEFSVCQFFADDSYEYLIRYTSIDDAMARFKSTCNSVGAKIGTTKRVILTDVGDSINLEWEHGKGITFPAELAGKEFSP